MVQLAVALALADLLLAVAVALVAVRGIRRTQSAPMGEPALVAQALQRSRLQFVVVATSWSLTLAGLVLAFFFDAQPERIELLFLLSEAFVLCLLLVFEASLYGAPVPADANLARPPQP